MKNSLEHDEFVRLCINDLRRAPTDVAWTALKNLVLSVWRHIGEAAFAKYFDKYYLSEPWHRWYLGALPFGGSTGQQGIEGGHAADKRLIGRNGLRAAPAEFFNSSLPKILARACKTLSQHPPEEMTHEGSSPLRATLIREAEVMISNAGGQPYYRLADFDGRHFYAVNTFSAERRKMNSARGNAFGGYYDYGELPSSKKPEDKDHYKNLRRNVFDAVMVRAHPVPDRSHLRPWAQKIGLLYGPLPRSRGQLFDLDCSCSEFYQSYNLCVHVVAMGIALEFVDASILTDTAQGRRAVGRPRADNGMFDTSTAEPKRRTAEQYLEDIRKNSPMHFHRRYVMVLHNGTFWLGNLRSVVDGMPERYDIEVIDEDVAVEWDETQLASGLAKAMEWGKSGTYDAPARAAAAAARAAS